MFHIHNKIQQLNSFTVTQHTLEVKKLMNFVIVITTSL